MLTYLDSRLRHDKIFAIVCVAYGADVANNWIRSGLTGLREPVVFK